ncbi:MAG: hypothetical protein QW503_05455 [Sulfolobales archaeon]
MASKRGCSLYSLVNEIFEIALKAEKAGVDLRHFVEREALLVRAKKIGFVPVLESLWHEMIEVAYTNSRELVVKSWFESGVLLAKYYAESGLRNPLRELLKDLEALSWNVSEMNMKGDDKAIHLSIRAPKVSEPYVTLLSVMLEGVLTTFGYRVINKEVTRSFIKLEALREAGSSD